MNEVIYICYLSEDGFFSIGKTPEETYENFRKDYIYENQESFNDEDFKEVKFFKGNLVKFELIKTLKELECLEV